MSRVGSPADFLTGRDENEGRTKTAEFKPKGAKFSDIEILFVEIGTPTREYTYRIRDSRDRVRVLRYDRADGTKRFRIITQHKGGWYLDSPPKPWMLYRSRECRFSNTIYVCEGERTADAAATLGLCATTSMGGVLQAGCSDWSLLEGKQVVILRDFDEAGMKYAREVAQLCLAGRAGGVKIVTLPGLAEGEGLVQWLNNRLTSGSGATDDGDIKQANDLARAEIEAFAQAEQCVERDAAPAAGSREAGTIRLQCLSEVTPEPIEWVWSGIIPRGKLTLLIGEQGVGKSLVGLDIAAAVTRGDRGPNDEATTEPGAVILCSGQDGLEDTVIPRLTAAGADLSRVYALRSDENSESDTGATRESGAIEVSRQLMNLEAVVSQLADEGVEVRLIVVDPISQYLEPEFDRNGSGQVVTRLTELAERSRAAILVLSNPDKRMTRGPLRPSAADRELALKARSVWTIARDLDNSKRRLLLPFKTNLCDESAARAFSLEDGVVNWEPDPAGVNADEYFSERAECSRDQWVHTGRDAVKRAVDWLKARLKDGRVRSLTLRTEADDRGISYPTLRRGLHNLHCVAGKDGLASPWYWSLPKPDDDAGTGSAQRAT